MNPAGCRIFLSILGASVLSAALAGGQGTATRPGAHAAERPSSRTASRPAGPFVWIPPRLGATRVEPTTVAFSSWPGAGLSVRITGPGRDRYRIVGQRESKNALTVSIEASTTRTVDSWAEVIATAEEAVGDVESRTLIDVAPFVVRSSCDAAAEIFVVEVPASQAFVTALGAALRPLDVALTVLRVPGGNTHDVWVQDAVEIGGFVDVPVTASLAGLRGRSTAVRAAALDANVATLLEGEDRTVLHIGEPRADRRWIDWFGNLEASPPCRTREGIVFPYGRIVTGRQRELTMHPDVMAFLEAQGVQTPALVVDTSFLLIGHVDELLAFVPDGAGFAAVMPSPRRAWEILAGVAARGLGATIMPEATGFAPNTTVQALIDDLPLHAGNDAIARSLDQTREAVVAGLGCTRVIELPVLFHGGRSLWPDVVNGLVVGKTFIAPQPFGPVVDGRDVLAADVEATLAAIGVRTVFLDDRQAYARNAGDVHCGTNARRVPGPQPAPRAAGAATQPETRAAR